MGLIQTLYNSPTVKLQIRRGKYLPHVRKLPLLKRSDLDEMYNIEGKICFKIIF